MNENTVLKNQAKMLTKKETDKKENDLKRQTPMTEELSSLKDELRKFKISACQRLDKLEGRSCYQSSTSCCSDEDSVAESNSSMISSQQRQKKKKITGKKHHEESMITPVLTTLRYEGNNPQSIEESPDEIGRKKPTLRPGTTTYSGAVRSCSAPPTTVNKTTGSDFSLDEKVQKIQNMRKRRAARESKTLIFSSSITRGIQKKSFNEDCRTSNVIFHEFKGKTAQDIVRYMPPHLEDEHPTSVVLVAGGNDLPNRDISMDGIRKVANCLIEGGLRCKTQYGVDQIYISSIMPRSHSAFQGNRHQLNQMLKTLCEENDFVYIDNDNIVLRPHVDYDGVHLNDDGSYLLRENLLDALNC